MKLLLTSILIIAMLTSAIIPDPIQLGATFDYNQLPDADLRLYAEEAWEEGREESAILLLDYIVDQGMGDTPAARAQRNEWIAELEARDSALGQLKAFGWGAVTGRVDSGAGMAGATLADFFVYGDLRDLVNQIVFEDDKDELIILLSGVGVITTAFPPADPAVSFLKLARKSAALSEPLVRQMTTILKVVKAEGGNSLAFAKLKEAFTAIYQLSENTETWASFTTLLKQAKNLDEVKLLAKIAGNTRDGARKLSQLITVASQGGKQYADDVVAFLQVHGQKGMDTLYAAMRKGPDGLKFVAKHPTLTSRTLKNAKKLEVWGVNELTDWYHSLIYKLGPWVVWIKRAITGLLFAAIAMLWLPRSFFRRQFWKSSADSAVARETGQGLIFLNRISGVFGIVLLVLVTYVVLDYSAIPSEGSEPLVASVPGGSGGEVSGDGIPEPANRMLSVVFIGLVIVVQLAVLLAARTKIASVAAEKGSIANRIKLLENQDTWLDLPLFVGLAGTICAFVLISIDAGLGRIFAYLSTVLGIIVSVVLRMRYYHPAREKMIRGTTKIEGIEA